MPSLLRNTFLIMMPQCRNQEILTSFQDYIFIPCSYLPEEYPSLQSNLSWNTATILQCWSLKDWGRLYLFFRRGVDNAIFKAINWWKDRSSPLEVFLGKGVLKICSKFKGEHPCWSVILLKFLLKLLSNFIEITLRHGCSAVNLLHFFGVPFPKNISEGLLLEVV